MRNHKKEWLCTSAIFEQAPTLFINSLNITWITWINHFLNYRSSSIRNLSEMRSGLTSVFAHACWYVNIRWFLEIRNNSLYWKYSFLNTRECFWNRYSTECLFLILIFKWFILISNNSSIQSGTPINIFIYIIVW